MSKSDYDRPILVTGAAGRIGSVGRIVTEQLLAQGFRVRAHVRVDDERSTLLREMGAEIVVGDMLDLATAHRAVEGCERLCFVMSVSSSYLEAATNIAVVAKHHSVQAFVNLSQMTVSEMDVFTTTPSPQQKQHWLAEQMLSWSGLPVVEVRPTAFMEGLFLQATKGIAMHNKIMVPFGKGKNSAIAASDVARVITKILSAPDNHIGKTYHLTGPVSQDIDAVAREFSAALDRTITYVDVPPDMMREQLVSFGMQPHVISHVMTMAQLHRENRYDRFSNDVEKVTGVPSIGVREFAQKNANTFAAPIPSDAPR
jgi:uncharacterized protein YbjT (DUF2867 family)